MAKQNSNDPQSYSAKIHAQKIARTIVCVLLCFISIIPFYIMVINATRASANIQRGLSLIPEGQLISNWNKLLVKSAGVGAPLWKCMANSCLISIPATILQVYFSTFTAYGITVYNFKLRNMAASFIMAIMMIPAQVSIIGFMNFMMKINLYNTYIPLIIPAVAAPSTYYFMKQYMAEGLSVEIVEAARIDGSGEFKTFNSIVLPLMKPAMATQAIFAFIASWNNLFTPSMILVDKSKNTLPMFIQTLRSEQFRTDYGMIYIGLTITVLPIFVVYFALSKYIIAGVALGGVKE
ncbi:MAG: carbohydrate ABC transporter permease [Bacteroidales bacterium]|nr:carbohydrate ABC transporter permease [Clostridium sp.]MCM1203716.1 carbohydrate ABC transporter permease [Bacteroidales bacterium]